MAFRDFIQKKDAEIAGSVLLLTSTAAPMPFSDRSCLFLWRRFENERR